MKFNEIKTRNELADFLGIKRKTLTNVLYIAGIGGYYKSFEIPKKSGGVRKIDAPTKILKAIQRKLYRCLYSYYDEILKEHNINVNISHAFARKKGIISNAKIHRNKRYILNVDLKDFFDCFHFGRVRGFFVSNKYFRLPEEVATVIAQLTCYKGKLPQGAPTSPIITNYICNILDYKILSLAKKYRLDYTRYADDLTFSTNDKKFVDNFDAFFKSLDGIITKNGFKINEKKTRLVFKDSRQTVTGLTVNKRINVSNTYYKATRAMANSLYTKGEFYINGEQGTLTQLEGRFTFINEIERYNNKINGLTNKKIYDLNAKEKELQKFLFYKYFYANPKPVIVTEGKTDVLYIKAALKSLYKDYPNLIEKNDDDKFQFQISFFRRSNRIRFFFNMNQDGADAMKNLYRFFSDIENNRYINYFSYFNNLSKRKPINPVIFVFDNEINNGKKPLKNFLSFCGINKPIGFKNGGFEPIISDGNLYLATHQLVNGKNECEIEDLFEDKVINHKINGKSFTRDAKFDNEKFYGKDHFAKYVYSNYNKIDFSKFRPLLDSINQIIISYK